MKHKACLIIGLLTLVLLAIATGGRVAQGRGPAPQSGTGIQAVLGTAFTYQGRLTDGGSPANGSHDFEFKLWDEPTAGGQVGSTVTKNNVTVTNGLFTVQLDFGNNAFNGDARYLGIGVRPGTSTGAYTTLAPRQALTATPYALALPGLWPQLNATSPNLIGGYSGNGVTSGVVGATIAGGGGLDASFDPIPNLVTDNYSTVGGGADNRAGDNVGNTDDAAYATVGGGLTNTAGAFYATVGGGWRNTASHHSSTVSGGTDNTASDLYAAVGGGSENTASGRGSTVSGGTDNTASGAGDTVGGGANNAASGGGSTIGGGTNNTVNDVADTVGGGQYNTADGPTATVGGGDHNTASGWNATVPGGSFNTAQGDHSFAAGSYAKANHEGAFVWGDSTVADVASTADDQFIVRASGGVWFGTTSSPDIPTDRFINTSTGAYLSTGGVWTNASDRVLKENFAPVDNQEILARLAGVSISAWNYKGENPSVRHIGPTAQDFHSAFGVGEDNRHISTVDADGVALAAIQGLYQMVQEKDAQIATLEVQVNTLKQQNATLEARLAAVEQAVGAGNVGTAAGLPVPRWFFGGLFLIGLVLGQRWRSGGGQP